jgi:hypothetical protein
VSIAELKAAPQPLNAGPAPELAKAALSGPNAVSSPS